MLTLDEQFLVFLIFLLIIIYLVSMINRFSANDLPRKITYIDPYDLKNGDLVCISYNNLAGVFVGSFTHSVWVHTGIIWVDPVTNIRYVLEGAIYRQEEYKNYFKIPFLDWMNINRNNLKVIKYYSGPEIDSNLMMEKFEMFMGKSKLDGFNPFWIRFLYDKPYEGIHCNKKYACFEVIIILCQELGIYKKTKCYTSYFPCDVVMDNVKYCDGVSYSKIVGLENPCRYILTFDNLTISGLIS